MDYRDIYYGAARRRPRKRERTSQETPAERSIIKYGIRQVGLDGKII